MNVPNDRTDLIIINGKVVTVDRSFSIGQAIAVKDGWITAVGTNEEIHALKGPKTEVIDLKGKTILPGANDAHMHGVIFGANRPPLSLDLAYPAVKSLRDMAEVLRTEVQKTPKGKWIHGFGWDMGALEECKHDPSRFPRKQDFDAVSPDNPIVFYGFDGHTCVANSKALELAGITKETADPSEGVMMRDPDTGEPTGLFKEPPAQAMVFRVVPNITDTEIRQAIATTQHHLNINGITSYTDAALGVGGDTIYCGHMGSRCIDIYKELHDEGKLTARVSIGLLLGSYGSLSYADIKKGLDDFRMPEGLDEYWLRLPMVKVFADGVPMTKTSWMWNEYLDGGHGALSIPGETEEKQYDELIKIISLAHQRGFQVGVHATGDRASDAVVDGFVKAMQEYPRADPRHYVIHGDFCTPRASRVMAAYRIGIAMQPTLGVQIAEIEEKVVGAERAAYEWPTRTVLDAGVVLTGSSDCPCSYPNWRVGVQSAVLREAWGSNRVSGPEQCITVEEAIRMYTMNGAWQDRMEHVKGSIEPGKLADLQVLNEDILTVDPHRIGDIRIDMTMVGGKVVYQAD